MLNAPEEHRQTLLMLLVLNGISIVAMQFIVPAMPDLQAVFNTNPAAVQLTLTIFMVGYAVAQIVYGPLSDRYGRKPILMWSMGLLIFGSFLGAFSNSIELLIVARFVQSVGAAAGFVLPPAVARDVYGAVGAPKAIAWISIGAGMSALFAPFAGGLVHETLGWRVGMIIMGGFGILMALTAGRYLHESLQTASRKSINIRMLMRSYIEVIGTKSFLPYLFALAFVNGVFYAFFAGGAFVALQNLGLSPSEFGLMMIPLVIFFVPSAYISTRLAIRFGRGLIISLGALVTLISSFVLLGISLNGNVTVFELVVVSALLGWGNGQVIPITTAEAVNLLPGKAGTASAALGTSSMLAGAAASFIFGLIHDGTAVPMAAIMTLMGLLAFLACVAVFFKTQRLPAD